jgi:hypothetical protein
VPVDVGELGGERGHHRGGDVVDVHERTELRVLGAHVPGAEHVGGHDLGRGALGVVGERSGSGT